MANVDDDLEIINGDEADEDATDLKNVSIVDIVTLIFNQFLA